MYMGTLSLELLMNIVNMSSQCFFPLVKYTTQKDMKNWKLPVHSAESKCLSVLLDLGTSCFMSLIPLCIIFLL